MLIPSLTNILSIRKAKPGWAMSFSAVFRASFSSESTGTTLLARPIRYASMASMESPLKRSSLALPRPTSLGSRWVPPPPGITPMLMSARPSFGVNGNTAKMSIAGANETALSVQYYNSTTAYVNQYLSPFEKKSDSVGVLFRVNLIDLISKGLFNPAIHGPVEVRGDSVSSAGDLSWTSGNVILKRDTLSVANGSFWSGIAYLPKGKIMLGAQVKYKFVLENTPFGGGEFNIVERTFSMPGNDTTLGW